MLRVTRPMTWAMRMVRERQDLKIQDAREEASSRISFAVTVKVKSSSCVLGLSVDDALDEVSDG